MRRAFLEKYLDNVLSFFQIRHTLNYNNTKEIKTDYRDFYNEKFNILWGYYEILRKKNDTIISQFYTKQIDHEGLKKFRTNVYNFNFIEITKGNKIDGEFINIVQDSLRSSPQDFNKKFNVPKSFQNLDYFSIDIERSSTDTNNIGRSKGDKGSVKLNTDIKLNNLLTNFYKNTEIQRELDKHPFYVVLNEEVYFFLMLHLFTKSNQKNQKKTLKAFLNKIHKTDQKYGLKQLLKYTTSVILCDNFLYSEKDLNSLRKSWKNYFGLVSNIEKDYRRIFNQKSNFNINEIVNFLHPFCNHFLKKSKEKVKKHFDYELSDKELLNLLTRFHVKPYEYLLDKEPVLPDFFVFPIFQNYKNTGENQLKTKNLPLDFEGKENNYINLSRPVLFSCYVKSIFEIDKTEGAIFDESPDTIRGFHLTKVVAKELAAPIVQSEFFGPQILNLIRPQAIKSSLAAVMARNQSHNVGSHVLNKMSSSQVAKDFFGMYKNSELCFLQDFLVKNDTLIAKYTNSSKSAVKEKLADNSFNKSFSLATFEQSKNKCKPVYILTQKPENDSFNPAELSRVFNNYLKQRMDFVADVATSDQFELANKKYLISDIFRSFERNLLLLHNISGKGEEFPFTFKFEYYESGSKAPKKDFDPIVSIPNDVLGDQAFYILLENIIRNTAKHAPRKEGYTTFTIKIEDAFDDFFKVSIYDDIEYDLTEEEISKYTNLDSTKKQRRNRLLQLVAQRNNNIAQEILDPKTNEIRAHGWGTIEMKIACCYLNGIASTSIDDTEYAPLGLHTSKAIENNLEPFNFKKYDEFLNIQEKYKGYQDWSENLSHFFREKDGDRYSPLLQAIHGSNDPASGFGYSFLLKKPKEVLILDEQGLLDSYLGETLENSKQDSRTSKSETIRKALQQIGIDVYHEINVETIYDHSYLLVVGESVIKYKEMTNLPQEICSVELNEQGDLCDYGYFDFFNKEVEIVRASKQKLSNYLGYALDSKDAINLTKVFNKLYFKSMKEFVCPLGIGNSFDFGTDNLDRLEFNSIIDEMETNPIPGYYEHHGLEKETFNEKIGTSGFVELYGSSSKIGFYFISLNNKIRKVVDPNDVALYNITDTAYHFLTKGCNTCIAIVDERIQKVLNEEAFVAEKGRNKDGDFVYSYKEIFQGIKITVPEETEVNLNQTGLNREREKVLQWIDSKTKTCHYLIIHFGIIESLRIDHKGIGILEVKDEVKKLCRENKCKLVITSGRGFTKDVASLNEYFLSYSSLSNLALDKNNRSKAHLVSVLNALRKPITNN